MYKRLAHSVSCCCCCGGGSLTRSLAHSMYELVVCVCVSSIGQVRRGIPPAHSACRCILFRSLLLCVCVCASRCRSQIMDHSASSMVFYISSGLAAVRPPLNTLAGGRVRAAQPLVQPRRADTPPFARLTKACCLCVCVCKARS